MDPTKLKGILDWPALASWTFVLLSFYIVSLVSQL
jgi:hypothetical protein